MISRRNTLRLGLYSLPTLSCFPCAPDHRVGDQVQVIDIPKYALHRSRNADLQQYSELVRACLGNRYRIISIDAGNRLELDVTNTARLLYDCVSCSVSLDPVCVARTAWAG